MYVRERYTETERGSERGTGENCIMEIIIIVIVQNTDK
jgi:hypothetical protein